uniref:G-protein coupled receptors family 1 profile domain-containing protein n=1 Tax=Parascaris univalens TaxID=6257 RepID=A0A915AUN6_PARUN
EPIASDYVELGTLLILFIIGGPINLAAYTQIAERPSATRLDILKRHLNYSDLLVLFVYVPSRACWLLTYDWRGGNFLCKLVKFLHTFAFQISSNVIVCIALDRLLSVISPTHRSPEKAQRRTKGMLITAWFAALLISTPQFAVWKTFLAFEELNWSQCMQIWEIIRVEQALLNTSVIIPRQLMDQENVYVIVHMMLIFWVPATIVMICYIIVSCWVYLNSRPSVLGATMASRSARHEMTTCQTAVETEQRPLKSILKGANGCVADDEMSPMQPQILITDKAMRPTLNRGSLSSANNKSSATVYGPVSYMGNSQSYNTKITRSRALRVSFLLVAAYIICWLPYNGLSLYQFVDPAGFVEAHANKVYCLHSIMVFNSVINPYLYGLFGSLMVRRRNDFG